MDVESIGAGAGGGIFAAILAFFGINKRIERVEKDIESIQSSTVWRNTCAATHKGVDENLLSIKDSQKNLQNTLNEILQRLPK